MSTLNSDATAGKVSRFDNGYLQFGLIYTDLVIRMTNIFALAQEVWRRLMLSTLVFLCIYTHHEIHILIADSIVVICTFKSKSLITWSSDMELSARHSSLTFHSFCRNLKTELYSGAYGKHSYPLRNRFSLMFGLYVKWLGLFPQRSWTQASKWMINLGIASQNVLFDNVLKVQLDKFWCSHSRHKELWNDLPNWDLKSIWGILSYLYGFMFKLDAPESVCPCHFYSPNSPKPPAMMA